MALSREEELRAENETLREQLAAVSDPLDYAQLCAELAVENTDLRRQLAEAQAQLAAVPIAAILECIGPDDYDFTAPTLTVLAFADWLEVQRATRT